jgi:Argonaute linker 2 domain
VHTQVLAYGQSDYVRQFGMNVETAAGPLPTQARILQPPTLQYGQGSKDLKIVRLSTKSAARECLIYSRLQGMARGTCMALDT